MGVAHHRLDGVLGGDLRDAHLFQFGFGLDDAASWAMIAEDVLNLDSRLLLLELVGQIYAPGLGPDRGYVSTGRASRSMLPSPRFVRMKVLTAASKVSR